MNTYYIDPGTIVLWNSAETGDQYALTIHNDENADDPRKNNDHLDHMICWHRRYNIGDDHNYEVPYDCLIALCKQFVPDFEEDHQSFDHLFGLLKPYIIMLPIMLYDHSGLTISTSNVYPYNDKWDGGQIGWIWMDKETAEKLTEAGKDKDWRTAAINYLTASINEYDTYLRGEIYGYKLYKRGENNALEEIDNCWGFYGNDILNNGMMDMIDASLLIAVRSENITELKLPAEPSLIHKYYNVCLTLEIDELTKKGNHDG